MNGLATSHALADRIGQDISTFGRIRPLDERLDADPRRDRRRRAARRADLSDRRPSQRGADRASARRARAREGPGRGLSRARLGAVAALGAALGLGCALFAPKPAWELPPPPAADRPFTREDALTRVDLPNGLRVLVHEDHRLPRVSIGLTLPRGAAIETPAQAGGVSFMAELLERGAGKRDALAYAEAVDALGANFGASADWDSVALGISGLSRDFDVLLGLLAEAALRPRFDAREVQRARAALLAALEKSKDDPATLASWHANRAVYGAHRFALPVSGTPETAARLDVKTARAYHQRLFVPNGAIASVTGDVDAAAVIAALRERFGAWPSGALVDPGPPPPAQAPAKRTITVVDRPDLGQARIVVGHEGIARTDDDRIAVSLFNLIVGGSGFSSRLMAALRAERGAHLRRLVRLLAAARAGPVLRRHVHARREAARGARHPARGARARAQRSRPERTSSPGRARSRRAASRWGSRPPTP